MNAIPLHGRTVFQVYVCEAVWTACKTGSWLGVLTFLVQVRMLSLREHSALLKVTSLGSVGDNGLQFHK